MVHDLRYAVRSLARARALSMTVIVTLALGIGANAAVFSLVRAVLLRPLVNRGEDRILYIRQSAGGIGTENTTFSVPEIQDLRERVRTLTAIGEFSTVNFTAVGLGEPRQVRAGVVNGNYFEVLGLRPVLGRLLGTDDDGPGAQGAAVSLTGSGPLRFTGTRASWAERFGSARAPPRSWGCWSHRFPTRRKPS